MGNSLSIHLRNTCPPQFMEDSRRINPKSLLENIFLVRPRNKKEFTKLILGKLYAFINKNKKVKLIIIDSISHFLRHDENIMQKTQAFMRVFTRIMQAFNVAIVVCNEITTKFVASFFFAPFFLIIIFYAHAQMKSKKKLSQMKISETIPWTDRRGNIIDKDVMEIPSMKPEFYSENRFPFYSPSLGVFWTSFVNFRIYLDSYRPSSFEEEGDTSEIGDRRNAVIMKSSAYIPSKWHLIPFELKREGFTKPSIPIPFFGEGNQSIPQDINKVLESDEELELDNPQRGTRAEDFQGSDPSHQIILRNLYMDEDGVHRKDGLSDGVLVQMMDREQL